MESERRLRHEAPHIGAARHRIADLEGWKACGTRNVQKNAGECEGVEGTDCGIIVGAQEGK